MGERSARSLGECRRQIVVLVALRPVSHAELDAEVHTQPNEQNRERDREQVQRAHHHQAHRGGDRKPDEQVHEDGENDLRRMQGHPENDQHDQHRPDAVDHRAILHGRELFVGDGDWPGKPNPGAEFARQIEVLCGRSDGVGRVLARLEGVEIEDRLDFDEGAAVGIGQRLVADQFPP